jgi:hypothetical protein
MQLPVVLSQLTLVPQAGVAQSMTEVQPHVEPRWQRGPGLQVAVQFAHESPLFPQVVSAVPSVQEPETESQQPWLQSVPTPQALPQSCVDSQAVNVGQSVVTVQPQVPVERQK